MDETDAAPPPEIAAPLGAAPGKTLSPAARRALAEAALRRRELPGGGAAPESGGPAGPEPTRYGDWERKGLSVEF